MKTKILALVATFAMLGVVGTAVAASTMAGTKNVSDIGMNEAQKNGNTYVYGHEMKHQNRMQLQTNGEDETQAQNNYAYKWSFQNGEECDCEQNQERLREQDRTQEQERVQEQQCVQDPDQLRERHRMHDGSGPGGPGGPGEPGGP